MQAEGDAKQNKLRLLLPAALKTVDSSVNVHVTLASLKLLLYQRYQIPEPINVLQRKTNLIQSSTTMAQKRYLKKSSEIIHSLKQVEDVLHKVANISKKYKIAIGLGSSLSSLKEIFTIKSSSNESERSLPENCNFLESLSRQLCLTMVEAFDWMKETSPSRVFIFVKMLRPDRDIGVMPWANFKIPEKKHMAHIDLSYDADECPDIQQILGDRLNKISVSSDEKENYASCNEIKSLLSKINSCSQEPDCTASSTQPLSTSISTSSESITEQEEIEDKETRVCTDETETNTAIWYHIPVSIKGFKS